MKVSKLQLAVFALSALTLASCASSPDTGSASREQSSERNDRALAQRYWDEKARIQQSNDNRAKENRLRNGRVATSSSGKR